MTIEEHGWRVVGSVMLDTLIVNNRVEHLKSRGWHLHVNAQETRLPYTRAPQLIIHANHIWIVHEARL